MARGDSDAISPEAEAGLLRGRGAGRRRVTAACDPAIRADREGRLPESG